MIICNNCGHKFQNKSFATIKVDVCSECRDGEDETVDKESEED